MREMSIAEDRDWLLSEVERYRRESSARIAVKTRLQAERDAAVLRENGVRGINRELAAELRRRTKERDAARATLAKVRAIVADPQSALVVDRIREVLEPTPKGTKP